MGSHTFPKKTKTSPSCFVRFVCVTSIVIVTVYDYAPEAVISNHCLSKSEMTAWSLLMSCTRV